jgi:hypothetical protein
MRIPAAPLWLFLGACVVVPVGPPPEGPPPGPPPSPPPSVPPPAAPSLISEQQAVRVATDFARSRGLQVWQVREVHLDRRGRYRVILSGDWGRDHGRVLVDGYTGQVLRAKLRNGDRWDED